MINARAQLTATGRAYWTELIRAAERHSDSDLEEGIRLYEAYRDRDKQKLGVLGRIKHTLAGRPLALKGINPLVDAEDAYKVAKAIYEDRLDNDSSD